MKKTALIFLTSILIVLSTIKTNSQIRTISEAINKAGQQRMLSQRMAKDFLFLGIWTDTTYINLARTELSESLRLFEKNQQDLFNFKTNNDTLLNEQLKKVNGIWEQYKYTLSSTPSKNNAEEIILLSKRILIECDNAVSILEKTDNNKKKSIINVSGKQRMLSQKIALYYIADLWDFENGEMIKNEYNRAKEEFWKSLRTISSYKGNSNAVKNKINVVKSLFKYETKGFKLNKVYASEMFQITNELQQKMDVITKMYETLEM